MIIYFYILVCISLIRKQNLTWRVIRFSRLLYIVKETVLNRVGFKFHTNQRLGPFICPIVTADRCDLDPNEIFV